MNIAEPIIRIEKRLVSLADDLKELKELKEGLIKVNQSLDNLKTAINKHEEKSNTTEHKKTYRPFTPDEFADTFTIGEPIIFRRKQSKRLYEYNVLFIGCCFLDNDVDVVLGNDRFSLKTLFNNYEWRQHDSYEWKPFGMEE